MEKKKVREKVKGKNKIRGLESLTRTKGAQKKGQSRSRGGRGGGGKSANSLKWKRVSR